MSSKAAHFTHPRSPKYPVVNHRHLTPTMIKEVLYWMWEEYEYYWGEWHPQAPHKVRLVLHFNTQKHIRMPETNQQGETLQVGQPFDIATLKLVDVTATEAAQAADPSAAEVYIQSPVFSNLKVTTSDPTVFTPAVDGTNVTQIDDTPVGAGTANLGVTADVAWTDPATETAQTGTFTATAVVTVKPAAVQPNPDVVALEVEFNSITGSVTPAAAK